MKPPCPEGLRAPSARPQRDRLALPTLLAVAMLAGGCAPDAWSNRKATGFDAWIDRIAVECAPLYAGSQVITANYSPPNYGADDYDQWLDQTSRLYYKKISPQTYLTNIGNFFDAKSVGAAQCAVDKLPAVTEPPPSRLQ